MLIHVDMQIGIIVPVYPVLHYPVFVRERLPIIRYLASQVKIHSVIFKCAADL